MSSRSTTYFFPKGYSLVKTILKSNTYLKNPIQFITKSVNLYSETYSSSLGINKKLIITQNPNFINYILKENHKNYKKSELATKNALELFGNGLLFSNGEYWLKQRRLVQPAFHRKKIEGLNQIVVTTITDFLSKFPTGENIDIYPLANQISFNIVIKSLFNINLSNKIIIELNQIFVALQEFLIKDTNQPLRKLFYSLTGEKKIILKKSKRLRKIFKEIITERKSRNEEYFDLLDMLLNTKYKDTGECMSEEQVIDEALIIVFAGHETTANTISWLLYLIASNKRVYTKIMNSIHNCSVFESVSNEYIKSTINEAMRLYPPAWITERATIKDDKFEQFKYPKNTIIIPFFYGLHRDKNFWENELEFYPERFVENPKLIQSKYYFPFGNGPRMCIGNNFAMMEISFFIYLFFKKFEIQPTSQIPVMKPLITLRPDKVLLNIYNRKSS